LIDYWLCLELVSPAQAVCSATLSTLRPRHSGDPVVQGIRAVRYSGQHVGDVACLLHAHRAAVHDLRQSERLHGRQRELSVYKSTRTRSSQRWKGTGKSLPSDERLEGRVCRISEEHSSVRLGRIANGQSPVLEPAPVY